MTRCYFAALVVFALSVALAGCGLPRPANGTKEGTTYDIERALAGYSNGVSSRNDRVSGRPMHVYALSERAGDARVEVTPDPGVPFGLNAQYTQVGDRGLEAVSRLKSLTFLDLSGCKRITGAGLAHLRHLPALAELRLSDVGLTDAGLVHLEPLTRLRWLDLGSNDRVTDAGLAHLKGLKHLTRLDLLFTKVTDAGVRDLKAALPGCEVRRQ